MARYEFYPAVFRSHARLTYTEVWAKLSAGKAPAHLADALRGVQGAAPPARSERGAIDFETVETRMVFDAHGKIERIVAEPRNDAHRLIEECMLAANVCAGNFLAERGQPALYRVHDVPRRGSVARAARVPRRAGAAAARRRRCRAPRTTRSCWSASRTRPDFALLQTHPAALAEAGGLHAARTSATSASPSSLRALHLADPALPRPAGAPRDQGGARTDGSYDGRGLGRARPALLRDRAARRRREPRRRELAQVLLHARPRRRGVRAAPSPA